MCTKQKQATLKTSHKHQATTEQNEQNEQNENVIKTVNLAYTSIFMTKWFATDFETK